MNVTISIPAKCARDLETVARHHGRTLTACIRQHLVEYAKEKREILDLNAATRRCAGCGQLNVPAKGESGIIARRACKRCSKLLSAKGDPWTNPDLFELMVEDGPKFDERGRPTW